MREIMFRAWDKVSGTMRHGAENSIIVCQNNPDDFELMQYTGLHDKNDKEIYEGDIVRYEDEDGDVWAVQIIWDTGEENIFISGFTSKPIRNITDDIYDEDGSAPTDWTGEIEIIGNIYENEELLK